MNANTLWWLNWLSNATIASKAWTMSPKVSFSFFDYWSWHPLLSFCIFLDSVAHNHQWVGIAVHWRCTSASEESVSLHNVVAEVRWSTHGHEHLEKTTFNFLLLGLRHHCWWGFFVVVSGHLLTNLQSQRHWRHQSYPRGHFDGFQQRFRFRKLTDTFKSNQRRGSRVQHTPNFTDSKRQSAWLDKGRHHAVQPTFFRNFSGTS